MVRHSIRIWIQFRKFFGYQSLSLLSPIASNHLFTPSRSDSTFQRWHEKGIKSFASMFQDGCFVSFNKLSEKYNLPNTHFFRYLQVRQYVRANLPGFPSEPIVNAIDTFLSFDPLSRGALSKLYSIISMQKQSPIDRIKAAWEQDLGHIPDDLWVSILSSIHKSSICARLCLLQFKVVHRAHMSKTKLSNIYPDVSPTCDKCNHSDATLIHMYWMCPKLQKFWHDVFHTLSIILKKDLDLSPTLALFGIAGEANAHLVPAELHMVAFSLLLARRAILLRWKGAALPTLNQWHQDIMSFLKLEMLRFSTKDSKKKFYETWEPFLIHFHNTQCYSQPN